MAFWRLVDSVGVGTAHGDCCRERPMCRSAFSLYPKRILSKTDVNCTPHVPNSPPCHPERSGAGGRKGEHNKGNSPRSRTPKGRQQAGSPMVRGKSVPHYPRRTKNIEIPQQSRSTPPKKQTTAHIIPKKYSTPTRQKRVGENISFLRWGATLRSRAWCRRRRC